MLGAQVLGDGEGVAGRLRVEDELDEPERSRRSMKISPPWSRRRWTQPATRTAVADARGASGRRPRRRGSCWARGVLHRRWRPLMTRATAAAADSTLSCSPESMSLQPDAVLAQDGNVAGAGAVGLLELALERAPGELLLDGEPRARAPRRPARTPRTPRSSWRDEEVDDRRAAPAARSAASSIRSMPGRPAHAGRRRAAEQLDEPVVAPAAADARLRAERVGGELEDRARVVVEAAHERAVELVVDAGGVEPRADLGEVLAVLGARASRAAAARRA